MIVSLTLSNKYFLLFSTFITFRATSNKTFSCNLSHMSLLNHVTASGRTHHMTAELPRQQNSIIFNESCQGTSNIIGIPNVSYDNDRATSCVAEADGNAFYFVLNG